MGIIVSIIVVLMLIGSVLWLKPSASQQRQTQLRLLARQLGLDVRLSALPQVRRARVRGELAQQGVVYRLLKFGENRERPIEYVICRADAQSPWESESATQLSPAVQAELDRVLAQLPSDALAFEITPIGCGVYWRERGGEDTVRLLKQLLESMQQVLTAA
ncbi:MAG: hypothetical protein QM709_14340 [Spongiibacteraceae bacterium]